MSRLNKDMMLTVMIFATSCGISSHHDSENPQTEVKLGYLSESTKFLSKSSLLKNLNETGALDVCISFEDYKNQDKPDFRKKDLESLVSNVVNDWNELLKGEDKWKQSSIDVSVNFKNKCDKKAAKGNISIFIEEDKKGGTAQISDSRINLAENFVTSSNLERWEYSYQLLAHEYGHLLGLADLYFKGLDSQPKSVMNNVWELSDFTREDKVAIRHLWQLIVGEEKSICPKGYKETKGNDDFKSNVYCIAK